MSHHPPLTRAAAAPSPSKRQPTTLGHRIDALHAKLDRVLAETRNVGKIPEPQREKRR